VVALENVWCRRRFSGDRMLASTLFFRNTTTRLTTAQKVGLDAGAKDAPASMLQNSPTLLLEQSRGPKVGQKTPKMARV
jgi:hypothetical protein